MAWFRFNLTENRGTVLINEDEIQAICEVKDKCTEVYLKGQSVGRCFAVTTTVKEIEEKLKNRNNTTIDEWWSNKN